MAKKKKRRKEKKRKEKKTVCVNSINFESISMI
jgi:hypothetical protein